MAAVRAWARAFLLAGMMGVGCGGGVQPTGDPQADAQHKLLRLRADVQAQLAEPVCSTVKECRAVPLGSKPCGGPWSYVVFSVATTDSAKLTQAAARYAEFEADLNRRSGRVSDCRFVAPPPLGCVEGRCVSVNQR